MTKEEKIKFIQNWSNNPNDSYSDFELTENGFDDFNEVLIEIIQVGCNVLLQQNRQHNLEEIKHKQK